MGTAASVNNTSMLTCWKDIAHYMGKGVRTVQRWERELGLPVCRPTGIAHKSAVLARPQDLDAWLTDRWRRRTEPANGRNEAPAATKRQREQMREVIASLNQGIRTSRKLRAENRLLLDEMTAALTALKQEIYTATIPNDPDEQRWSRPG